MTDDIVPSQARAEEPLTPEEQRFDQLITDFGRLSVGGQVDVIFACCDAEAIEQIAARLFEYLAWETRRQSRLTTRPTKRASADGSPCAGAGPPGVD